jgi:hypothetical protein
MVKQSKQEIKKAVPVITSKPITKDKENKKYNNKAETKSPKPLWSWDKLEKGDIFSSVCYYQITSIDDPNIGVKNQVNNSHYYITKDMIEYYMWSADHYEREVKCTMT